MAYETSRFGDGGYVAPGETSNVTGNVSNHYGPRVGGGEQGVIKTEGGYNEATVNFSGEGPLYDVQIIPEGAIVVEVLEVDLTGTVTTATVGAIDISGADGTQLNYVEITTAGQLVVEGPTAGKVIVRYFHVAT